MEISFNKLKNVFRHDHSNYRASTCRGTCWHGTISGSSRWNFWHPPADCCGQLRPSWRSCPTNCNDDAGWWNASSVRPNTTGYGTGRTAASDCCQSKWNDYSQPSDREATTTTTTTAIKLFVLSFCRSSFSMSRSLVFSR